MSPGTIISSSSYQISTVIMSNTTKWTPENEMRLLLILLASYHQPGKAPKWEKIASLMGDGYSAGAVSQKFTKQIMKRDIYVQAQAAFGNSAREGGRVRGSGVTSPKKRKADEVEEVKVEEGKIED